MSNKAYEIKHATMCSGIGVPEIAAKELGWKNVFHAEIDWFGCEAFKDYFPESQNLGNIKTADFIPFANGIDVLTFGDPCQPNSTSGKRLAEKDYRYIWDECLRAFRIIKPTVVVNENVEGSISNGQLDKKISDLESEKYTLWPPLLIPSGAGKALHRRNRVFLVAYTNEARRPAIDIAAKPNEKKEHTSKLPLKYGPEIRHSSVSEILRAANGTAEKLPAKYRNAAIEAAGNAIHLDVIRAVYAAINEALKTK